MLTRILSTKKLNQQESKKFKSAEFELIDYDFVKIESVDFKYESMADLLIFTSRNAVKSVANSNYYSLLKNISCVCVGNQTRKLLNKLGFNVLETEKYADKLAEIVIKKYSEQKKVHFCGNIRSNIFLEKLTEKNNNFTEYEVYKTFFNPHKIDKQVDGILFYSPSGVQSFLKENTIKNQICFCIGNTTAESLKKYTKQIQISEEQSINGVINLCFQYFGSKKLT